VPGGVFHPNVTFSRFVAIGLKIPGNALYGTRKETIPPGNAVYAGALHMLRRVTLRREGRAGTLGDGSVSLLLWWLGRSGVAAMAARDGAGSRALVIAYGLARTGAKSLAESSLPSIVVSVG
jgi:hypothetical protein